MSDEPNFTRSCYATDADLYKAKAAYYEAKVEELTADRDDIRRKYIAEAKETDRLQTKAEELEEQVQGYAKNAAFYRSCALSGEVPINDDAIPYNPPRGGE